MSNTDKQTKEPYQNTIYEYVNENPIPSCGLDIPDMVEHLLSKLPNHAHTEVTDTRVWVEVPVNERLPKESEYYIVKSTAGMTREWFDKTGEYFGSRKEFKVLATHWLELSSVTVQSPTDTSKGYTVEVLKALELIEMKSWHQNEWAEMEEINKIAKQAINSLKHI